MRTDGPPDLELVAEVNGGTSAATQSAEKVTGNQAGPRPVELPPKRLVDDSLRLLSTRCSAPDVEEHTQENRGISKRDRRRK
jgi:hypothetical protein